MRLFTSCLLALATFGTLVAHAAERQAQRPAAADPATEARVIVTYRPAAALLREHAVVRGDSTQRVGQVFQRRADLLAQRAGLPLRVGRAVGERAHVVMATGLDSAALATRLAADHNVESVVVDQRRRALMQPNDPLYTAGPAVNVGAQRGGPAAGQWYLRTPGELFKSAINAEAAWDTTTGSSSIVVAVLDTGVRFDHVDLQGRLLAGYDFVTNTAYANDGSARDNDASDPGDWITAAEDLSGSFRNCGASPSSWHGTKVSGIIGAASNNGLGMAGIAPGVRILPVRVLGKCGGFDSDIAAGMRWAAGIDQPGLAGSSTPARVLNLSLGGTGACTEPYLSAVAAVNARGAVVVAAAGNSAGRAVGTPANCPGAIAVAGLRHAGSKVGFSDLGPEIAIAAPGGNCVNIDAGEPCLYPILTTANSGNTVPLAGGSVYTDSFDFTVGTSFATPMVAATAALMLSVRPELTAVELRAALQASARPFPTSGADNGPDDPTPVTACMAPGNADQLQCYCSAGLCGAGMLDAARAVAAVQSLQARITVSPAAPVASAALQLSGLDSVAGTGRTVVAWDWALLSAGGIVTAFTGSNNASTAGLLPTAAGTVTVRLTVTDDQGNRANVDRAVEVLAAPAETPPPVVSSGSGGGAASVFWLCLLAAATAALAGAARPCVRARAADP